MKNGPYSGWFIRELPFRRSEEGSVMMAQGGIVEATAFGRWSEALEGGVAWAHSPPLRPLGGQGAGKGLSARFARKGRAGKYGWKVAGAMSEPDPQGVQRLLSAAK